MANLSIRDQASILRQAQDKLKKSIVSCLDGINQNPEITELSEIPYVFQLSFSSLSHDKMHRLDPFYYDFILQKKKLCKIVENSVSLDQLVRTLNRIVAQGFYVEAGNTYFFHKTVCDKLSDIIKEL